MKIFVLIIACLTSISATARQGYNIAGKVAGINPPTTLYLYSFDNGRHLLDSTVAHNGQFNFKGKVLHPLSVSIQIKKPRKSLSFFLENDNYEVLMQLYPKKDSIQGGSEMRIQQAYDAETASLDAEMLDLSRKYEKLPKEERIAEGEALDKLTEQKMAINYQYIRKYPSSLAVLHIMRPYFEVFNFNQLAELKALFSPDLVYSDVYTNLLALYEKKKTGFLVGGQAPDFSLPNPQGKAISLSFLKGKYTVIDFWASWCTPCRAANQKIKPIYQKYKTKGFDIISISMDNKKDFWLGAIKKDQLPWLQVSGLTGLKDCPVAKKYNVTSLPTMFLLDKSGKVIAQNISEKELETLLQNNLL